jgi:DNA-directed RNA polymerase specialized sigma24 family protein
MTITTAPQQADTVLARDYERLKPDILRTVRGKLAASGVRFDDSDLDGFYNQAWHGVHTKLSEGERVENVNGLLVTITQRRALDEFRALRAESRVDAESLLARGVEPDFAARIDDEIKIKRFTEAMRERLDRREREAAALCYVQDYSRPEAAQLMGIKPRRMEKIMDGVSKKVGAFVGDIQRDEWCDARHSMIKAYALGLLDPEGERYRLAAEHLDSCSACRRDVLRMRGIAALTPPAPLLLAALAGTGGSAAGAGHWLFHGGGAAAKTGGIVAAGTTAVAATVAAVALTTHAKHEPPIATPAPTATVVAQATATVAPASVSKPAASKAKPVRHATQKKKAVKHKRAAVKPKVVVAQAPVRTPAPAPVRTAAPTVPAKLKPAAQKPATDGAGEFELGSHK